MPSPISTGGNREPDVAAATEKRTFEEIFDEALHEHERREAMPQEERWAGDLLSSLLGASEWLARDVPGGPPREHDLDLVMRDGRRIAVEVKTYTSPEVAEFDVVRSELNPVAAPLLREGWHLDFDLSNDEAADGTVAVPFLNGVVPQLEPILARIESEGLQQVIVNLDDTNASADVPEHPICDELRSLRLRRAFPAPWMESGRIHLGRAETVKWYGPDSIAEVVESLLSRVHSRLLRAKEGGADESHLFVWVPPGAPRSEEAGLATATAPPSPRWLPRTADLRGLDAAWAARLCLPAARPEVEGYSTPVWQLTDTGWRCWTRNWQPLDSASAS